MTLRDLTSKNHDLAESTPFMRLYQAKAITEKEYQDYLTQMVLIYGALEPAAEKAGILAELPGIARLPNMRKDLAEMNEKLGVVSRISYDTLTYYNYIVSLTDRDKIMAHVYVRYAGDMFGGQILKSISPGEGRWYDIGDNLPKLRQKIRELSTANLADEANIAFEYSIDVVKSLI